MFLSEYFLPCPFRIISNICKISEIEMPRYEKIHSQNVYEIIRSVIYCRALSAAVHIHICNLFVIVMDAKEFG